MLVFPPKKHSTWHLLWITALLLCDWLCTVVIYLESGDENRVKFTGDQLCHLICHTWAPQRCVYDKVCYMNPCLPLPSVELQHLTLQLGAQPPRSHRCNGPPTDSLIHLLLEFPCWRVPFHSSPQHFLPGLPWRCQLIVSASRLFVVKLTVKIIWLFSLSDFANLSTEITNQWEFRVQIMFHFLLSENSPWFQSAKISQPLFKVNKSIIMSDNVHLLNVTNILGLHLAIR